MATDAPSKSTTELSIGAGVAIAGIWLACSSLTIFIMMILFVWGNATEINPDAAADSGGMWILIVLIAAPVIAAYSITKVILNKDH